MCIIQPTYLDEITSSPLQIHHLTRLRMCWVSLTLKVNGRRPRGPRSSASWSPTRCVELQALSTPRTPSTPSTGPAPPRPWRRRCSHRGPDDAGVWTDPASRCGAGAPASVDRRPVGRGSSADGLLLWPFGGELQRRNLQPRRACGPNSPRRGEPSVVIRIPRSWSRPAPPGGSRRPSVGLSACSPSPFGIARPGA